jgi:hypothetical protein
VNGKLLPIAAVVLAAGALFVTLLRGISEPTHAPLPVEPADNRAELSALEKRVDSLEESNQYLERKVVELSRRPALVSDGGAAAPAQVAQEIEQLRAEVRGMVAGEALSSEGGKAYLKDAVREVQEELFEQQRVERFARMAAAQEKNDVAQKERWKQFVTTAHLDYGQEQTLNKLLDAEATQRKALMDDVKNGSKQFGDVRPALRDLRNTTDAEVKKSLNEEQYNQYSSERRESRRDEGGAGNRGGRPPAP